MGGSSVDPLELWNDRVPALVLLSFTMQVTLLVTAEFRRCLDKAWLRAFVWSVYMLADWAAIYALGHLSVANVPGQHHLMLLWAPFLLVHLGGQDNITAYSMEDNRLWLRHLQALVVQAAAAAAYVLYPLWSSSSSSTGGGGGGAVLRRFRQASVILYVVGILKYGERVAALWWASSSRLGNNYLSLVHFKTGWLIGEHNVNDVLGLGTVTTTQHRRGEAAEDKKLFMLAHMLLDFSKKLIMGPLPYELKLHMLPMKAVKAGDLYKVAEWQLSLMHDMLYTKAPVIKNSTFGFCIRIVSGACTAAAFVLFHQGLMMQALLMRRPGAGDYYCGRRHCSRADVAVTYVLLVGAVVLEGLAMVATVCSSWTEMAASDPVRKLKFGLMRATPTPILSCVARVFLWRRRRRHTWSGTMGQHNLLELCVGSRSSFWSKGAKVLRLEDWWNTMVYSGSARVTKTVEDLVMELAAHLNDAQSSAGSAASSSSSSAAAARFLDSSVCRGELQGLKHDESGSGGADDAVQKLSLVGSCDMDETILVWHIATDIYLRAIYPCLQKTNKKPPPPPLADVIQALSNYMLFLLAARPGMLPASTTNRNRYVEMCYCLTGVECASPNDLADILSKHGGAQQLPLPLLKEADQEEAIRKNQTLEHGCWLGAKLCQRHYSLREEKLCHHPPLDDGDDDDRILNVVAQVWAEILCYAGHGCSGYSHARRLSNGAELVTLAAIVMEYVKTGIYRYLVA